MAISEDPRKVPTSNTKRRRMIMAGGGGAVVIAVALVGALFAMGRGNDCAFGALEAFAFGGTRNADSAPDYVYRFCTTTGGGVIDGVFQGWELRTGFKSVDGRMADGSFSGSVFGTSQRPARVSIVKGNVVSSIAGETESCGPTTRACDGRLADFIDVPALDHPDPIIGEVRSLDCHGGTYSYSQSTEHGFAVRAECRFDDVTYSLGLHPEDGEWTAWVENFEFADGAGHVRTSAFLSWFDKGVRGSIFEKKLKTSPFGLDVKNGLHARGARLYRARVLQ